MKCPKCNKEILDNIAICPHCGSKVKSGVRVSRSVKSKINEVDKSSLVGGVVSKGSFIKLSKKAEKKDVYLKDYNNYIDYKEAKEKMALKNKTVYKSPIVDKIVSNSNINEKNTITKEENKKENKKAFIHIVSVKDKKQRTDFFNVFAYGVVISLWIFAILLIVNGTRLDYYFHEDEAGIVREKITTTIVDDEMIKYNGVSKSGQSGNKSSEGITSIVYDNQYMKQFTLSNNGDVIRLIATDSIKQKDKCPEKIVKLENEIIEKYGILAVNLCEMDEDFARELVGVVRYIYNEYPSARNYLTNLTLANVDKSQTYIAAFMPIFTFATSNTTSGYPVAVKTQILLNAKYFLDNSKINSTVKYGARSGYFPKNATRSSTVAHEFGHYLSYIALLNYHNSKQLNFVKSGGADTLYKVYDDFTAGDFSYNLLTEAYSLYKMERPNDSFEQFRKSISEYAVTRDNSGNYIYDETIAEAFHDVYLNRDEAALASKCIVKTLEQKL